jgi:hypothetical protein
MTILKMIPRKYGGRVGTGFMWLRIGNGGGNLINTVMKFRVP